MVLRNCLKHTLQHKRDISKTVSNTLNIERAKTSKLAKTWKNFISFVKRQFVLSRQNLCIRHLLWMDASGQN